MPPATELQRAGQSHIVFQLRLDQEQGRVADAKIQSVPVVALRISRGRIRRIAVEEAGEDFEVIAWIKLDAHARDRERIGRTALRHVRGGQIWPAEGAINEIGGRVREDEFVVGGELSNTDVDFSVEERLLVPDFVKPERFERFDGADRAQAADMPHRRAKPMNIVAIGVQRSALPAEKLFEIGLAVGLEEAVE